MRTRLLSAAALAGTVALMAPLATRVAAQAATPTGGKSTIPRMPDGKPDLQGTYDVATLTPIERTPGSPLVLTDEQAAKLEKEVAARKDYQAAPIKADRDAPPLGGDGSS